MKKLIISLSTLILLLVGWYFVKPFVIQEAIEEVPIEDSRLVVPTFTETKTSFKHRWKKTSLAFAGGALIDIDQDGTQEIFLGGGEKQKDQVLKYENGEFKAVKTKDLSDQAATYGTLSLDLNKDEKIDLIVARDNGLFVYYNQGENEFKREEISLNLEENSVPLTVAATDINKDGHVDLYVSTFVNADTFRSAVFNDQEHGKKNFMLLNSGSNSFKDITEESGLAIDQNTFLSAFADLDNDGWQDLVVSENTGRVRIFKNLQNSKFQEQESISNYAFWMGLAIDDIDNDGDLDIFATNMGNTIPLNVARGDLEEDQILNPEWILLRNEGDFKFTDSTEESGLTGYEFAWGAMFTDFNLDGLADLTVLENYIKWPAHKLSKLAGRAFIQNQEGEFLAITEQSGLANKYYGNSPLITDFNNDGYPDLVFINLNGPTRVLINDGGDHNYIKLKLKDDVNSIGARATLTKNDDTKITKEAIAGLGLLSDNANELFFGLGKDTNYESLEIKWPSGETQIINAQVNKTTSL